MDAIITIDDRGRINEFNLAAETMFARARATVMDQELAGLIIPPELRDKHRRGLERYLAGGHGPLLGKRMETTAMRADGKEFPVELTINKVNLEGPPFGRQGKGTTVRVRIPIQRSGEIVKK